MSKDEFLKWIKKNGIWIEKSKIWINNNKKWVLTGAVVLSVSFAGFSFLSKKIYAVEVDSKMVAMVNSKSRIDEIVERIIKDMETATGLNIITRTRINYKEVFAFGKKMTPENTVEDMLKNNLKLQAEAYSINVDGSDIALLKDKSTAEAVLAKVKDEYLKSNGETGQEKVGFLENVNIMKKIVDIDSVQDENTVFDLIMESTEEAKIYEVKSGDTISEIAEKFKIKQVDIVRMNPELDIDKIQIGQKIILSVPKYLINIKSIENKTYEEEIPYEVKYEDTSELYKGQTKVKAEGKEGRKLVTAEIEKINGIASNEKILDEKVIQEPQSKLVLRGTKERPSTLAYGVFTKPSRGSITSRFGQRWGKLHTGIDIGIPSGTSIKAADGGKVIFAGWQGNYGKLVIIDHENGYTTYYGHNSSLKVKAGQRVARGEVIALSGATGNVTGPHLHFEVRKNGVPQNPLKFVDY